MVAEALRVFTGRIAANLKGFVEQDSIGISQFFGCWERST